MQPYELIRSGRRTLALEVRGGHVIVRAPYRTPQATIDRFVASHAEWIARGVAKQAARAAAHPEPTDAERAAYIRRAKAYLPQRVAYYSERMGLYPTQVRITGARTRFGSCSSQGHICFSWRLMQYPPEAIDYVVVHEPWRGVLRAHRALSAGLEGLPRPAAGMKKRTGGQAVLRCLLFGIDFLHPPRVN